MIDRRGELGAQTRATGAETKTRKEEDVRDPETVILEPQTAREVVGSFEAKKAEWFGNSWVEDYRDTDGAVDLEKLRGRLSDKLAHEESFANIPEQERQIVRAELLDMAADLADDDLDLSGTEIERLGVTEEMIERAIREVDGEEDVTDEETEIISAPKMRELGLKKIDEVAEVPPMPEAPIDDGKERAEAIKAALKPKTPSVVQTNGSYMRRVDLKSVERLEPPESLLGADGRDIDYLLSHAQELGLGDLGYKTGRELQRAIEYFDKQEKKIAQLKKETGFFGRFFGSKNGRELNEALAERRMMQDRFDRIQSIAVENRGISPRSTAKDVGSSRIDKKTPIEQKIERTRKLADEQARIRRF